MPSNPFHHEPPPYDGVWDVENNGVDRLAPRDRGGDRADVRNHGIDRAEQKACCSGRTEQQDPFSAQKDNTADSSKKRLATLWIALTVGLVGLAFAAMYFSLGSYVFALFTQTHAYDDGRAIILISIDGFRYDFIYKGMTPVLERLANEGIMGPLKPQFPTYTFPNHFSIVTGMRPSAHGIVGNVFFDPDSGQYFHYMNSSVLEPLFWNAEPIWNLAEKAGLLSASMFWPGSEVFIKQRRPTLTRPYDGSISASLRVQQMLKWVDSHQPKFMTLYMSDVDHAGHYHGINSSQIIQSLYTVNQAIEELVVGLNQRGLLDKVNLLIVSDHGMANVVNGHHIALDTLVKDYAGRVRWADYGPVSTIIPQEGALDSLHADLVKAAELSKNFKVYLRDQVPPEWHYGNNSRIAPIILVADVGWTIDLSTTVWDPKGNHGYDPDSPEMEAIFIGRGPRIVKNSQSFLNKEHQFSIVENLDVYPLMVSILDLMPSPSNGTMALTKQVFSPST